VSALLKRWRRNGNFVLYDGYAIIAHLEADIRDHWTNMHAARRNARRGEVFGQRYWTDLAGVRKVRLLQALAARRAGRRNTAGVNL
jgi:hypothetical protein